MIWLLMFFLYLCPIGASESIDLPSSLTKTPAQEPNDKIYRVFQSIKERALCFGAGTLYYSASLLAKLGWSVCQVSPWAFTIGNECLLLDRLCTRSSEFFFTQMCKGPPSLIHPFISSKVPFSQFSWHLNQMQLSQIPVETDEDKKLVRFLEEHWLAKSNGYISLVANWICPCLRIPVQVHPETTHSYARDPSIKFSQTYLSRVEALKQCLPHPYDYPLILTRPSDLQDYLPPGIKVSLHEKIETTLERLSILMQSGSKAIVDFTDLFKYDVKNKQEWLQVWNSYREQFLECCKAFQLDPDAIICIQRVLFDEIGGIRLLPLAKHSLKKINEHHNFLIEWISYFGLSANMIELDRCPLPTAALKGKTPGFFVQPQSKEEFLSYLLSYEENWRSKDRQKTFMLEGVLHCLEGLLSTLGQDKWQEILDSKTKSALVQLSFLNIKEQLQLLSKTEEKDSFFKSISHLELIHANLSTLLEILSPYTPEDFPQIYRDVLTSIPENLKPLTSCGIHSFGMTSLTGIFKSIEKSTGRPANVLYGENTYYQFIKAAKFVTKSTPLDIASEEDWKEADVILAHFNPVLRTDAKTTEYREEKVAETLRKALLAKEGAPLTLALDTTIDYIDSLRVAKLLNEFQNEIEEGLLNVICYRSGLKYDIFGMDNYCGSTFFMIHNQDEKWSGFDLLLRDKALQTDLLSLNWFCLSYKYAFFESELYKKYTFDNTRALLNKLPSRLFHKNQNYRVVPFDETSDPGFIDIKVSGHFHEAKASALVAGLLFVKCMEANHPIFTRMSIGFYHPNFTVIYDKDVTTIRLTLGLDPSEIDLLAKCFEMIDSLNGFASPIAQDKMLPSLISPVYRFRDAKAF